MLTGTLALPLWAAGALTALLMVFCALAFRRANHDGLAGEIARVALIMIGGLLSWIFLESSITQELAAERRALEARSATLATQSTMPGSPLACLDAMAGDTVEGTCERTLFATPEAMASAVSYVSLQLRLLADASAFARRGNVAAMEPLLQGLRRALESDRYGLVAHVLATRDGCTAEQCPAMALFSDPRRVYANLRQRAYDFYVTRHSGVWPGSAPGPTARAAPAALPATAEPGITPAVSAFAAPRPPGPDVFFPTSNSIPPINIMNAEPPGGEPETTGATPARSPASQRRSPPPKQAAPPPMNLNVPRGAAP